MPDSSPQGLLLQSMGGWGSEYLTGLSILATGNYFGVQALRGLHYDGRSPWVMYPVVTPKMTGFQEQLFLRVLPYLASLRLFNSQVRRSSTNMILKNVIAG